MLRKIYYDKLTGYVLHNCLYNDNVPVPSFDDDYQTIKDLNIREKETIGLIILENGEYEEDFRLCSSFRVNPQTLQLEFSYPDPNATEPQEPVYQKPLTEQVKELEERQALLQQALDELLLGGM